VKKKIYYRNLKLNHDIDLEKKTIKTFCKNLIFKFYAYLKRLRKNFLNIERSQKISGDKIFIKIDQSKFFINFKNKIQRNAYIYNKYEDHLNNVIEATINSNSLVIDIGANVGFLTMKLANVLKKKQIKKKTDNLNHSFEGKVVSFEPSEKLFRDLLFNISINNDPYHVQIDAYNLGVGKKSEEKIFYEANDIDKIHSSSFIKNDLLNNLKDKNIKEKKISVISLDDFLLEKYKEPISFIKIDTGGDELDIIKGANKIIDKFKPTIIFEFDKKRIEYLNIDLKTYNFIFELKYDVYLILKNGFFCQIKNFNEVIDFENKFYEICCLRK